MKRERRSSERRQCIQPTIGLENNSGAPEDNVRGVLNRGEVRWVPDSLLGAPREQLPAQRLGATLLRSPRLCRLAPSLLSLKAGHKDLPHRSPTSKKLTQGLCFVLLEMQGLCFWKCGTHTYTLL